MKYIVGLGNPGEKYVGTRHNVGFAVLDACVTAWQLPQPIENKHVSGQLTEGVVNGSDVQLVYPSTFMNNSGSAAVKLVSKERARDLIVVHDDIDLPFGEVKVGVGRGAGGNNGVQSIINKLGTKDFVRVRIGIAPKSFWTGQTKRPAGGGPLERFVLKQFSKSEQKQLPDILNTARSAIETILSDGPEKTMNNFN